MATILVKKDGSGNAVTVQQGIQLASLGDTVEIEAGTFNENVDLWKGIILKGAGKDLTVITTTLRSAITARPFIFVTGQSTLNLTSAAISSGVTTADYEVGRIVTASGIPANTRIVSKTDTSLTLSAAVTSAASSRTIAMALQNDAGMRVRGTNGIIRDLKIVGFDHPTNPGVEYATLMFRPSGLGASAANGWEIFACEFEANGEYAVLAESSTAIGNLNFHDNIISGKTFVGDNPAVGNQFTVWNVPRQLVTFQANNTNITFQNNMITGVTGGLTIDGIPSYNTAVTIDAVGAIISGNTIDTVSGTGYGLRVRGLNALVQDNYNIGDSGGYYLLPNHSVGVLITVGTMIANSSKFWICTQEHTSSVTNAPAGVDGGLYWSEITLETVNASESFGVGVQSIGSNTNTIPALVAVEQENPGDPVHISYDPAILKTIPLVSANPAFSNEANWRLVGYIYKHTASSKRLYVGIRGTSVLKDMKLRQGQSGETYILDKVIVSNIDKTFLAIDGASIEGVSSYDITLK